MGQITHVDLPNWRGESTEIRKPSHGQLSSWRKGVCGCGQLFGSLRSDRESETNQEEVQDHGPEEVTKYLSVLDHGIQLDLGQLQSDVKPQIKFI